ncbi:MAG: FAD-binding oxidoreductase, partial [Spirochaetota bacterium]
MESYTVPSRTHLAALAGIIGEHRLLSTEDRRFNKYSHDQVSDERYAHAPDVVVFPETTEQVCEILRYAHAENIAVTPRGAGTGLSGGAVPVAGGICLSLERMNRVVEIDTENLVATVEPGVVTKELDRYLKPHNLFFAGYPMSEEICTIGGNVAENAGGGRAVKYGVTGNYVLGIEGVRADGKRFELGGKRLKDVTGYNLLSMLVGSEGTLCVVTRIYIRLLPRPAASECLLALFDEPTAAIAAISAVIREGGVMPTSVEFMDGPCLHASCRMLKETIPYEGYGAMLLFEVDGQSSHVVHAALEQVQSVLDRRAGETITAETQADNERFWKIRKQVPWALKAMGKDQTLEDISMPIASVPKMMEHLRALADEYGILIPCFGHAADGNLHANPIRPDSMDQEQWRRILPEVLRTMYRRAYELGGTISGEHGIGHKRRGYMNEVLDDVSLEMMLRVKHALDPKGILNPGKI